MLWDCFWGHFWPKAALQLSVHLRMYDSNLHRRPHAMQWPLLKSPKFWVFSAEYYIGLLGAGPQCIGRLDTRAPGSCCETRDLLAWRLVTLSSCSGVNLWVSNKGGLPCHCHDYGLWAIVGAMPPCLIFCGGNCPHCPHCPPGSAAYAYL